jgi:lysophospholipase L1-like esterase
MKQAIVLPVFISLLVCCQSVAQLPPYWNDIQQFKKQDSTHPPQQHVILFVGSSSFTKWTDVQSYFPSHAIINRGFGGSTLVDVIRYANDVIFPYHPKQVVIYCGENDLAYVDTVTPPTVLARFKTLFNMIRQKMPDENIVFVSIKPSPSRKSIRAKVEASNVLIKAFLASQHNTSFVDVYHPMLAKNGQPMPELFLQDSLHMKPAGYAIWKAAIEPYLVK